MKRPPTEAFLSWCRRPLIDYCAATEGLSASEREVDRDLCVNFDGFTVQEVGLVPPLPNCIDRSRRQHRVSRDRAQVLDRSVFPDHSLQNNLTLDAGRTRQRRIVRLNFLHQQTFRYAL